MVFKVLVLVILGMVLDFSCVGRFGFYGDEKVSLGSGKICGILFFIEIDKLKLNVVFVFSIDKVWSFSELVFYFRSYYGNLLRKLGYRYLY